MNLALHILALPEESSKNWQAVCIRQVFRANPFLSFSIVLGLEPRLMTCDHVVSGSA
jgi:hypothetical protein